MDESPARPAGFPRQQPGAGLAPPATAGLMTAARAHNSGQARPGRGEFPCNAAGTSNGNRVLAAAAPRVPGSRPLRGTGQDPAP